MDNLGAIGGPLLALALVAVLPRLTISAYHVAREGGRGAQEWLEYRSRRADSNRGTLHYETTTNEARLSTRATRGHEIPGKRLILWSRVWTREPERAIPYEPGLYPARLSARMPLSRCEGEKAEGDRTADPSLRERAVVHPCTRLYPFASPPPNITWGDGDRGRSGHFRPAERARDPAGVSRLARRGAGCTHHRGGGGHREDDAMAIRRRSGPRLLGPCPRLEPSRGGGKTLVRGPRRSSRERLRCCPPFSSQPSTARARRGPSPRGGSGATARSTDRGTRIPHRGSHARAGRFTRHRDRRCPVAGCLIGRRPSFRGPASQRPACRSSPLAPERRAGCASRARPSTAPPSRETSRRRAS